MSWVDKDALRREIASVVTRTAHAAGLDVADVKVYFAIARGVTRVEVHVAGSETSCADPVDDAAERFKLLEL